MPLIETAKPCFVVSCDQCGAETYPVAHEKIGAIDIAIKDCGYDRAVSRNREERWLCPNCQPPKDPS